ncbi:MAG: TonB-dependent receptor [Bacteroidales bacterium]|nr:TonB-dependent receptor [Bacteroidales bacterium]
MLFENPKISRGFIVTALACCAATSAMAIIQPIELRGRVTTQSGELLAGVAVRIEGTQQTAMTNSEGFYRISVPKGEKVRLSFSYVGYATHQRDITLHATEGRHGDKHQHLDVVLRESDEMLQSVEVVGRREATYKNTHSFSGTKTALDIRDIPQSIGYVTKELILDQGAVTVNDVVKNISGITTYSAYNDFSIRGFRVMGNRNSGNLLNGMRAQSSFFSTAGLVNIERVEVIKGPAAALFGNSSPGGVINRVTKKPINKRQNTISTGFGSFNTLRTSADFTGPLNEGGTLLYRLNLGYDRTDGFRDLQGSEQYTIAPSLSYVPNKRTQLNVDVVYHNLDGKLDRGQTIFAVENMHKIPITRAIAGIDDYLKEKQLHLTFSFTQKLTDALSLNAIYMNSAFSENLYEHTASGYVYKPDLKRDNTKAALVARKRQREFRNNSVNTYLNWDTNWGKLHSRLLIGYDYFEMNQLPSHELTAQPYLNRRGTAVASLNANTIPLDADGNPIIMMNVPFFDLADHAASYKLRQADHITAKTIWADRAIPAYRQSSHGIYLQEHIEYAGLKVLFGLRQEFFRDDLNRGQKTAYRVTETALLPRVGVVYSVLPNVNIYGTWLKGYDPQVATVQSSPRYGGPFAPMRSTLWEVGVKSEWFDKRISATLSLFDLTQRGTLHRATDPADPGNTDYRVQTGKENSRGIELDVLGYILPNWSLATSYTYNRAKVVQGEREIFNGQQQPNTPKHAVNVWTKYIFNGGVLKNFGFGLGYNFVDTRNGSLASHRGNDLVLPAYQLVNTALYYKINRVQLQLNVNNLFNQKHWVGGYDTIRIFPGKPRSVLATLTYRF